ncbi:hypothetical protein E3N88_00236 [Mikania micrantha]|uniref:Uncharacterized protein n=1 Tax=Mikania micrantha TaxID=192012 RepID=A0A5N6Q084_9ASTR|nr:hypothetical protein E3N88_00236 [Mikania micrantha]
MSAVKCNATRMSRTKGSFVRMRSLVPEEESYERVARRTNDIGPFVWNNHMNEDPFTRTDDKKESMHSHHSVRKNEGHSHEPLIRTKNNPKTAKC